jgi:hypothetical protein
MDMVDIQRLASAAAESLEAFNEQVGRRRTTRMMIMIMRMMMRRAGRSIQIILPSGYPSNPRPGPPVMRLASSRCLTLCAQSKSS